MKEVELELKVKRTEMFYDRDDVDTSIEDYGCKPLILDPKVMEECYKPDYVHREFQIVWCTGGNGCDPAHIGKGIFFLEADGQSNKWDRYSVLGVPKPEVLKEYMETYKDTITSDRVKCCFEGYLNS